MATKEDTARKTAREDAAAASNQRRNEKRKEPATEGLGVLRTKGGLSQVGTLHESDIPYPKEHHGPNFQFYGPQGFAAVIPDDVEIATYSAEQQFYIDESRVQHFWFEDPGRNLPKKRLFVVKAIHRDGRFVQLPWSSTTQGAALGEPQDAIGLRYYSRKGLYLLFNQESQMPVYCGAWDCWAQSLGEGVFAAFCTGRHAAHTLPNTFDSAGERISGMFSRGATTTREFYSE